MNTIVDVKGLGKYFPLRGHALLQGSPAVLRKSRAIRAVDVVSFSIRKGETFGLVGETGCGKSTTARCMLRLIEPSFGQVLFDGQDVAALAGSALRFLRREMQMVFQDPDASLNPAMRVRAIVGEPLQIHGLAKGREKKAAVLELLERVGLEKRHAERYPHEFSGGQQQRIGIARALASSPRFIVLDEPTSALDVSVKVKIADLLMRLQHDTGVSYLLITHDLGVVRYTCDEVGVMYLGVIVERASTEELFQTRMHPYTEALLSAIPVPDPRSGRQRIILDGEVPSPVDVPTGCRFHERCRFRTPRCSEEEPVLKQISEDHYVSCFLQAS